MASWPKYSTDSMVPDRLSALLSGEKDNYFDPKVSSALKERHLHRPHLREKSYTSVHVCVVLFLHPLSSP